MGLVDEVWYPPAVTGRPGRVGSGREFDMTYMTDHGLATRDALAQRYGVSGDAVQTLMGAVVNGNGSQAQFSHPELGGMGQWSAGGMTMVGDMFNNNLQALVANLCGDISNAYYQGPFFPPPPAPSFSGQAQSQGGPSLQVSGGSMGAWWPAELGQPSSSGSQNNLSYAIFPDSRRLAVNLNGQVTVYDTGDHQIGGVGQQQSGDASWTFTSQYGTVYLTQLPVVQPNPTQDMAAPQAQAAEMAPSPAPPAPMAVEPAPQMQGASADDIYGALEKLGSLREMGILTEEEFAAKKAELLARI